MKKTQQICLCNIKKPTREHRVKEQPDSSSINVQCGWVDVYGIVRVVTVFLKQQTIFLSILHTCKKALLHRQHISRGRILRSIVYVINIIFSARKTTDLSHICYIKPCLYMTLSFTNIPYYPISI